MATPTIIMALGKGALSGTDSLVASAPFFEMRLSKEQEHEVLHVRLPVARWLSKDRRSVLSSVSDTQGIVPHGELPTRGPMEGWAPGVRYHKDELQHGLPQALQPPCI